VVTRESLRHTRAFRPLDRRHAGHGRPQRRRSRQNGQSRYLPAIRFLVCAARRCLGWPFSCLQSVLIIFLLGILAFAYRGGLVLLSVRHSRGRKPDRVFPARFVGSARIAGVPAAWIGVRSYGLLTLWHFPVIVMTSQPNVKPGLLRAVLQIAGLTCSRRCPEQLIEAPIRHCAICAGRGPVVLAAAWRGRILGQIKRLSSRCPEPGRVAVIVGRRRAVWSRSGQSGARSGRWRRRAGLQLPIN